MHRKISSYYSSTLVLKKSRIRFSKVIFKFFNKEFLFFKSKNEKFQAKIVMEIILIGFKIIKESSI
jgi:hypothetical protein